MKLYIVRHGVTKRNKENRFNGQFDEPLEPEGFDQAVHARDTLPTGLCKIYCSDLIRAIQTAEVLNKKMSLEIEKCPEIREINFGDLTGQQYRDMTGKEIELPNFDWNSWCTGKYDFHSIGGESAEDVNTRINNFINKLKENHQFSDKILVVTHGGVIRTFYRKFKNTSPEKMDNASIHEFEI